MHPQRGALTRLGRSNADSALSMQGGSADRGPAFIGTAIAFADSADQGSPSHRRQPDRALKTRARADACEVGQLHMQSGSGRSGAAAAMTISETCSWGDWNVAEALASCSAWLNTNASVAAA
jgi:hypothetical protein